MTKANFYENLGLKINATKAEIKSAYRLLAKKYHPDTGGNKEKFLSIQIAWETLNDPVKKENYDKQLLIQKNSLSYKVENFSFEHKTKKNISSITDHNIKDWIKNIYEPLNKMITQIIKPLNGEIKKLSADPYDDELMENFCKYIYESRKKIDKVALIYKSRAVPRAISNIGLDLYHCFSQVQDALEELDRYTQGYVDTYLFDGKEMMKEAKRIQTNMAINKKNLSF